VPAERLLDRLVDDAHAAVADAAEDAELADAVGVGRVAGRLEVPGVVAGRRLHLLQFDERGEEVAHLLGEFRVAVGVLGHGGVFAAAEAGDEFFGEAVERVAVGGRVGHGGPPGSRLRVYLRAGPRRPPEIVPLPSLCPCV